MKYVTQSGTSLLEELAPLLHAGDYLAALNSLRPALSEIREESLPAQWLQAIFRDELGGSVFIDLQVI